MTYSSLHSLVARVNVCFQRTDALALYHWQLLLFQQENGVIGWNPILLLGLYTWQNKASFCLCLSPKVAIWNMTPLFSLVFWGPRRGAASVFSPCLLCVEVNSWALLTDVVCLRFVYQRLNKSPEQYAKETVNIPNCKLCWLGWFLIFFDCGVELQWRALLKHRGRIHCFCLLTKLCHQGEKGP